MGTYETQKTWIHNPIAIYLMACYAYEVLDSPFLADVEFDELGRYIKENLDTLEHRHKYLVDRESCDFTSGITQSYPTWPSIITSAAKQLAAGLIPQVHTSPSIDDLL